MKINENLQVDKRVPLRRRDDSAQAVIDNPVFVEMPDYLRKIRNNLILTSLIGLAVTWWGFGISSGPASGVTILGVQLTGLTDYKVVGALWIFTVYHLFHYAWCSRAMYREWRMRCAGVALGVAKSMCEVPGGNLPYQSLSTWLTNNVDRVELVRAEVEELQNRLVRMADDSDDMRDAVNTHLSGADYVGHLTAILVKKFEYARSVLELESSDTLHAALDAYEKLHRKFFNSENARWFVFDLLVPGALALSSLALLSQDVLYFWLSTV